MTTVSAKFVQEIELKDGTILSGYVYRQRPGHFIVFHLDGITKDPQKTYSKSKDRCTIQWRDVKSIRRSKESSPSWCFERVTLADGTTYDGQIIEQQPGQSMDIVCLKSNKHVTVKNSNLVTVEKLVDNSDFSANDLWQDRQYTNLIKHTDGSWQEGLIVLQHYDTDVNDSYVEMLNSGGRRYRIYMSDIVEYMVKIVE